MRLTSGSSNSDLAAIQDFSEWILRIGDGKEGQPNDGEAVITISDDILIKNSNNPLADIVNSTYPSLLENMTDPKFFQERAILAPTLEVVEWINEYILSLMPIEEKIYLSSNSISKSDINEENEDVHTPEYLNSIRCSGIHNYKLMLKEEFLLCYLGTLINEKDCAMELDW